MENPALNQNSNNPPSTPISADIYSMLKEYFELDENVRSGLMHPSFGQKALAIENKIRSVLNMPPASWRKNLR